MKLQGSIWKLSFAGWELPAIIMKPTDDAGDEARITGLVWRSRAGFVSHERACESHSKSKCPKSQLGGRRGLTAVNTKLFSGRQTAMHRQ